MPKIIIWIDFGPYDVDLALFYAIIFLLSLQHIKRAALQDFNASSAEVICEVGENGFVSISLKMLPIVYDLIFCQTIQYCSQSIHLFYVF